MRPFSRDAAVLNEASQTHVRQCIHWQQWVDPESRDAIWLMLMEDAHGSLHRPPLLNALWRHVASFLRFPGPLQMIYLIGGRQQNVDGREDCLDTVEAFDWWSRDWVQLPPMSSARVGAAATVLGNCVVVAGGYSERATHPLNTVEAFDPVAGSWRTLPNMPTRRYGLALVSAAGRVFAIGGDDGNNVSSANEAYDPGSNSWARVCDLPLGLAGGKAETHGGLIYYVGGCDQNEELSAAMFVYDPVADAWNSPSTSEGSERLRLKVGRTSFAMALLRWPDGHSDTPAHLLITGGVSGQAGDPFRRDSESLTLHNMRPCAQSPAMPARPHGIPEAFKRGESSLDCTPSSQGFRQALESLPPMPLPRSGCRSVALWPRLGRDFLPWSTECVDRPASREARPFVVVLGGETPCRQTGLVMKPCQAPVVLDLADTCWHECDTFQDGSPGRTQDENDERSGRDAFLRVVSRLRTNRVAFAITVAHGLPRVATHDG